MKTTIFTNALAIRNICARALVIALALIWWGHAAQLVAPSDAFIAAQSTQQGNVTPASAASARLTCTAFVEHALVDRAALFEAEEDAWLGTDPRSDDPSVLSALGSVAPHAALAIPERRLKARQVLLPGADWIRGHGARGAFSHPLARAPPSMAL